MITALRCSVVFSGVRSGGEVGKAKDVDMEGCSEITAIIFI
jgi:hypothetical protein